jgi:hypothetical protein
MDPNEACDARAAARAQQPVLDDAHVMADAAPPVVVVA